jgi:5-methylcytosine-specific restriction enzyme subunit McrC
MSTAIPIKNIYYLLCYAWDQLDQGELVDVSSISSTELVDLFAHVLCDGIRHLARRGLEQGYGAVEEDLAGIRGRIDITTSARRSLFMQGRVHCEFDELTSNTLANRILKSTLRMLDGVQVLDSDIKKRVHTTFRDLRGVEPITLTSKLFRTVRVQGNSRFYKLLLNICELIHGSLLVDEQTGTTRFRDFVKDETKMAKLFESFLRNFIARECLQWKTKRENILWRASSCTDSGLALLPRMQTDISLWRPGQYLIIEAKYYREALSGHFDVEKVRSNNLYQLLSYIMNAHAREGSNADGMLIYPQVDRALREHYEILGRRVSICTVDLSKPWQAIDRELRDLFC